MTNVDELMERARARARVEHPERFAPDGTGLTRYDPTCRHSSDERTAGCGDAWAHRLEGWRRERRELEEPDIPEAPAREARAS